MHPAPTARLLAVFVIVAGAVVFMPKAIASVQTSADGADSASARAVVRDVNNAVLGVLAIQGTRDDTLVVTGRLSGLTAGFHGFHIHAVGACDPTATDPAGNVVPFVTAGGHLNPAGAGHGQHAGDLPLLLVTQDGTARSTTESDAVTFADILDADGSAFIVHAAPDNYANIPTRYVSSTTGQPGPDAATLGTGDSGGRVACGVISRS
jgi:Cu-Zn family superoxide dismutase